MPDDMSKPDFWRAAGWRALRSFCQALITLGGLNSTVLLSTSWATILIAGAGYAVTSLLTSVVIGVPEVPADY
jgi:hypothetical protein